MAGYTPGEQPASTDVVKLNTNENPYPPCDAVLSAIREVTAESLRRYPPPLADAFRHAAAKVHGVSPEQIVATNGGDELLRLALTVFCDPRAVGGAKGVGVAEPSYSLYPVLAEIQDTRITRVALREDWTLPEDFAKQLNDAGCGLAIVVNPHAPSGLLEPLDRLERIARSFEGVLLVDEAYVDFAQRDAVPLLEGSRGLKNVLLLRSLSKGYSLAGLRFGYGMGHAALIDAMNKAKDSYNTDAVSQAAATAAMVNRGQAARSWAAVIAERARLTQALVAKGYRVFPSESNFILATPPAGGPDARSIYQSLKARGIFVRYFDQDRLRDKLRITIGTPEQNNRLLKEI